MSAAYRIVDEPHPGALSHLVVNPVWPLFAVMFAGAWCAWPWFALNAFALGSPTRVRETALAAAGFVAVAVLLFLISLALASGVIQDGQVKYALVAIIVAKLAISYWLYELQSRSFGLYEYFGGRVRNGILVIIVAAVFVKGKILGAVPGIWVLVLS